MRRASLWAAVIGLTFPACGSRHEDPCLSDPLSCYDGAVPNMGGGQLGSDCSSDDECAGMLRLSCIEGVCAFAGDLAEGDPCLATEECGEGLFCSLAAGMPQCAPAGDAALGERCDEAADCQRGLVCTYDGGFVQHCVMPGEGDLGTSCTGIGDCLPGLLCTPAGDGAYVCGAFDPNNLPSASWEGLVCPADREEAVAYFEVPRGNDEDGDFFRLPFPNDVRRSGTGLDLSGFPSPGDRLGLGVDFVGAYVEAVEQDLTGFGTNPVVYFRFSKPYQGAGRENVLLYDITEGAPEFGTSLSRSWGTSSGRVTRYVCENWLNVRTSPGNPLLPGHTYAALLTSGITTADGDTFARDADFDALLADATPDEDRLAKAHAAYAPLRAFLAAGGGAAQLTADKLLNAAVFTTQAPEDTIAALRAAVRAETAPAIKDVTVCGGGVTSPCDDGATRACGEGDPAFSEVHGRITLPIFQAGEAPYLTSGGQIELEGGKPKLQRHEDVCFGLTLPKGELPAAGFPLIIYAHGTGGSFTSGLREVGPTAAASSGAVLTIDLPQHGARKNGSTRGEDELFYNFGNPRAARDNIAQGSADLFSLVQWALAADAAADSAFGRDVRFDASRIVLFGHSQGATHASLALVHEPDVSGAVLSGVGGDLSEALVQKRAPIDIASALPFVLGDPEAGAEGSCRNCIGGNHPVLALLQSFFERVDPVNFAHRLRAPAEGTHGQHLFMTYGLNDTYTPEISQEAYATAAQLDVVGPVLSSGWTPEGVAAPLASNVTIAEASFTQGMRQYAPADGEDGHFVYLGAAGQADWERFVGALLGGTTPAIGE